MSYLPRPSKPTATLLAARMEALISALVFVPRFASAFASKLTRSSRCWCIRLLIRKARYDIVELMLSSLAASELSHSCSVPLRWLSIAKLISLFFVLVKRPLGELPPSIFSEIMAGSSFSREPNSLSLAYWSMSKSFTFSFEVSSLSVGYGVSAGLGFCLLNPPRIKPSCSSLDGDELTLELLI